LQIKRNKEGGTKALTLKTGESSHEDMENYWDNRIGVGWFIVEWNCSGEQEPLPEEPEKSSGHFLLWPATLLRATTL
jgi:hypothetical protein